LPGPYVPPPPVGPPPSVYPPYPDNNGPLLRGDPLLDRRDVPQPGWFLAAELVILDPHVKNRIQNTVQVEGFAPDLVALPGAELDWTASPRFELGYRMAAGLGEILVSYRNIESEGRGIVPGFDLDGSDGDLKSRLDVNVVDIDYSSREFSLAPCWDMKWKAGVRIGDVFYDTRALGFFLEQRASNNYFGAGPHFGLDLWRTFKGTGLALFTRIEGAALFGQVRQGFEESAILNDGSLVGAATEIRHTQTVPVLELQAGLSWSPDWFSHWGRFACGYQYEHWWSIGNAAGSRAELWTNGVFLRAEFSF
jgi:Legionella pneumophila major outer membrane protein precursor